MRIFWEGNGSLVVVAAAVALASAHRYNAVCSRKTGSSITPKWYAVSAKETLYPERSLI